MAVSKEPRINLLRYRQAEEVEKKSNIRFMGILALVVLLLLGAMGGTWWKQNHQLQAVKNEKQQLQQQEEQLSHLAISTATGGKDSELDQRQSIINALEKQVKVKSKHFKEIYLLSIPGVTIGKMDIKPNNNFTISAYCNSQAKFIEFLEQMRKLNFVKEVKNVSSKCNSKTGEVSFIVTLVWGEAEQ